MKRALCAALLLAAPLATLRPALAADPWYESYASALKAISSRNWTAAEAKLKAAIRDGPEPGRGVRTYGVRFVDYEPGFYLGLVYFNQQRYAQALEELKKVQSANLVNKGDPEYQQLVDMIELATIRVAAKPSDSQKEAETLIRFARDLLAQDSLDEARRAYESARQKDPGNAGLSALGEAIAKKDGERKAKADEDGKRRETAKKAELDGVLESARQHLEARRFRELRDAIARARATGLADPRMDELLATADLRERALIEKQPSPGALPTPAALPDVALRAHELEGTALRAFYAGNYRTAADLLSELAAGKARSARVLFYLACSNAALGLTNTNEKERDGLLRTARKQWQDARKLDAAFASEGRLVSPRILATLSAR